MTHPLPGCTCAATERTPAVRSPARPATTPHTTSLAPSPADHAKRSHIYEMAPGASMTSSPTHADEARLKHNAITAAGIIFLVLAAASPLIGLTGAVPSGSVRLMV